MDDSGKIACIKASRPKLGQHRCVYPLTAFSAADEFDGAEPGEQVLLEYCEMTQAEFDLLPEFAGW